MTATSTSVAAIDAAAASVSVVTASNSSSSISHQSMSRVDNCGEENNGNGISCKNEPSTTPTTCTQSQNGTSGKNSPPSGSSSSRTTTTTPSMTLYRLLLFAILPAWHTIVCVVGTVATVGYVTTHIYGPTLQFKTKDRNLILQDCPVSTNDINDLIVPAPEQLTVNDDDGGGGDYDINRGVGNGLFDVEPVQLQLHADIEYEHQAAAFNIFNTHGAAIIPSVLSNTTASRFRQYIVNTANPKMHQVFVLKSENRYRVMPTPFVDRWSSPSTDGDTTKNEEAVLVQQVMKEIATHRTLRPLVDNVLGPGASLISLSVITSTYGAVAQNWHRDTTKSAMTHPDDMVHEVTLTIPLQDTTSSMGPTGLCPGTHRCAWVEGYENPTAKSSKKKAGTTTTAGDEIIRDDDDGKNENVVDDENNNNNEGRNDEKGLPCDITASLRMGDALLYHTDLIHRGGAHVDPDAPDRAVLFVSFAESKKKKLKSEDGSSSSSSRRTGRSTRLGFGKVYSSPWRMWGLTIDDFPYMDSIVWQWSYLHPLGVRFFHRRANVDGSSIGFGWSAIDAFLHIYNRPGKDTCYFLSNSFSSEDAANLTVNALYVAIVVGVMYVW
eukprot:CAMPEP_0113466194 /NCGR_PEP_ID=MMETSP0014_2-20120614/14141_1 /TAXON_ID=2857 /ORGANISM="Nitzschia sp." /LENGTH=606 /DNA_ID=CAMNT_0000358399 /DNA_START=207 /DNA_END=2024 /DNA_ORIENTATION=+ /assembly_acc=CAM_ASM_000159